MYNVLNFLQKQLDALIYGFIGPFGALYIFPKFFLGLEETLSTSLSRFMLLEILGTVLMWAGAVIALWCALLMFLNKRGSASVFSLPVAIVSTGPYRYVRHPMMWALFVVLIGESLAWSSPMIALWFLIWLRFSVLYISRYEEPYLHRVFGETYQAYCKNTPRWIPSLARRTRHENKQVISNSLAIKNQ